MYDSAVACSTFRHADPAARREIVSVSISRIASQSNPPSTTSFVSLVLWRTCMKNSATSSILQHGDRERHYHAERARSTNATSVVTTVSTSSASSTRT